MLKVHITHPSCWDLVQLINRLQPTICPCVTAQFFCSEANWPSTTTQDLLEEATMLGHLGNQSTYPRPNGEPSLEVRSFFSDSGMKAAC